MQLLSFLSFFICVSFAFGLDFPLWSRRAHKRINSQRGLTARAIPTGWSSVGCVTDGPARALSYTYQSATMTQDSCVSTCNSKDYIYAGLQYGTECWCGNTLANNFGAATAASECNIACAGNSKQMCGGGYRLTLFKKTTTTTTLVPGWTLSKACVVDSSARILQGYNTGSMSNTPASCQTTCAGKGFSIAGVENGNECWCGNSFVGGTPPDAAVSTCNVVCTGDLSAKCGGGWRMQIYTTTTAPAPGWTLSNACVVDSSARILQGYNTASTSNTPASCQAACAGKGFSIAGVENGNECWCGNSFVGGTPPDAAISTCNVACMGDSSSKCGGGWRMQIYTRSTVTSTTSSATRTTATSTSASTTAASTSASSPGLNVPNTVVLDPLRLVDTKTRLDLDTADAGLRAALTALTTQADSWLTQGPWTVTSKKITPPGGNIHDYASQAPYFWASNTSNGCPYVQRDGERNPEAELYTDHADRLSMFESSFILTLAWYYTGKEQYARKAGEVLRTWFITPATRMNPNLNHAQIIPCANTGRSFGIIDWSQGYTSVLDAATILASGAPGWTASDIDTFHQWNVDYLSWLETSQFGKDETAAQNNHGTYAIMQSAGVALFLNNSAIVQQKSTLMKSRISAYINADGSQPLELDRTRSFHYSIYDLIAYTRIAAIGKKVGVDLWGYKGPQEQSIHGAVNFLIPAATGAKQWAYPELDFHASDAREVIHASADAGNSLAAQALPKVPTQSSGDLWPVRPAAEQ